MREKVGKSRNTVFFQWFLAPEGRKVGSLKRRVRSQLARGEMKNCTPLWREAHFQVKMYKTHHSRTTFGSCDAEKVHSVVARSTFPSQNVQNTPGSDHFWKLWCQQTIIVPRKPSLCDVVSDTAAFQSTPPVAARMSWLDTSAMPDSFPKMSQHKREVAAVVKQASSVGVDATWSFRDQITAFKERSAACNQQERQKSAMAKRHLDLRAIRAAESPLETDKRRIFAITSFGSSLREIRFVFWCGKWDNVRLHEASWGYWLLM